MKTPSRFLGAALVVASISIGTAARAQDKTSSEDAGPWAVTGAASLVSEYLFRGISQTQGKPTVQANLDFTHASGWYLGVWGSGVSHAAYNNGAGSEIDVYGGYRHALGSGHGIDLGIATYTFPGAHYTMNGERIKYDTQELKFGYSKDSFNATAWYAVSKRFAGLAFDPFSGAEVSTRGSAYFEVNWNPELVPGWTLNLHAGRQNVRNLSAYNFTDLRAGITYSLGTWQFAVAASHNNGDPSKDGVPLWTFFDADGQGRNVVGTRWVASVSKTF